MTVAVDAVVYYRVSNPTVCISNVENFRYVAAHRPKCVSMHALPIYDVDFFRTILPVAFSKK